MLKHIKTKLGNWMMAMSLLLLGTFLGFYLFSTYATEKERIEREMGYIFTNSIKEIESKLMGKLIKVTNKGNNQISINIDHMPKNNVAVFTSKTEIKKSGKKEIQLNNRIERRTKDLDDDKEVSGMISLMLKVNRKDSPDGILKLQQPSNLKTILPEVKKQFALNLIKGKISTPYTIVVDSVKPLDNYIAKYNDIPSNQKLWVTVQHKMGIIIMNILPQVLTTFLLFGFVALSFFLIIQSDKRRQEMFQLKTDFISNMTHELKTPIATISIALEAIERFDLQSVEKKMEYLEIARLETDKLSDLVDKVMQVSKMTDLEIKSEQEVIDLNALVGEILGELKPRITDKKIEIVFENSQDKLEVVSDLKSFKTIVFNLIDNAIKYNQVAHPRIEITSKRNEKYTELAVVDNGQPIPSDFKNKIFEKFYRVPQDGQIHNVKGHGLGLYIVENLAKSLGCLIEYVALTNGNRFIIKNIQTNA